MTRTELFAALMASTLLAVPAMAQSTQPSPTPPMGDQNTQRPMETNKRPMAASPAAAQTVQQAGQWRMSKLVGLDVYNNNNEKIGDINELIADKDGNVQILVIGVGGFLGMGEREVAVNFDSLRMSQDSNNRTLVTLDATKDSLKAAPEWRWAGDRSNTTGNGSAPTRQPVAK